MIIGAEQPTSGTITLGETVKVSYVDQNREGIDPNKTLWEVSRRYRQDARGRDRGAEPCLCGELWL